MPSLTDPQLTAHDPASAGSRRRDPGEVARPAPRVVAACALIVVVFTAIRTWVAAAGWFYWDDLILHGKAAAHRFPDPGFLLADHDGHLMPGGMALAWVAAHVAPLDFRLPLVQIAVLQLIAGAALARMLWVLLRGRPVLLVPLVLALAIPLGLPAATWWASAVNSLPMAAAMAWAVASTIRLAETGRRRNAVGAVLATAVGLLFVEKAVLVPVVAAAVLWCWWWTGRSERGHDRGQHSDHHDDEVGSREPLGAAAPTWTAVWRSTRWMWAGQAVLLVGWAAVFASTVGRAGGGEVDSDSDGPGPGLWALIDKTYRLAVGPTLAGGPWRWERWHPGPPIAEPPALAVVAGALLCASVLAWSLLTRERTGPAWAFAAVYPLASVLMVAVGRFGPDTAAEIVQTLRYHADSAIVLAAVLAMALAAPRRDGPLPRAAARWEGWALAGLVVVVVSSSSISTATYREVWAEQPSRDYVLPLVDALRARDAPMLQADVPPEVLLPVTAPAHRLASVLAGVPGLPPIGSWTTEPVVVDAAGRLHPADVVPGRTLGQGPEPGCGHRIDAGGTRIGLDGPLLGRDWVLRVNYLAARDGTVEVRLDEGDRVEVPVTAGLATVFVRVEGSGTGVTFTPGEGLGELCIGSGPVGVLVPR
ncbi:hypothetical protein [Dietzia psychralcaliphila]|uniref:hypothetical protein n=1 Tax=Dietzia psychralcaliphila TaxID=139021 RepID=UPI000D323BAF|nr:hypothetical protein [Dietzia psychralcaliphila]PTM86152.1 hypothetical protein C8N39_108108 [Dietzia psychralcaliphila]